ncbi:MAG: DUF5681 domain-containing protein [Phycisphaerales bacterium]|nr:DUF5681 domain-containing protein [Phycisphaerales bacterium]
MSDFDNKTDSIVQPERTGGITGKGWRPGQSGNPAGRPRRRYLSEELGELLAEPVTPGDLESPTKLRYLAERLYELSISGSTKALDILAKVYEPRKAVDARRLSVHLGGGVGALGGVNDVPTDSDNRWADFTLELPAMLVEVGLTSMQVVAVMQKLASEWGGGVHVQAGNAALRRMLDAGTFPVRPGYELPVIGPGEDVGDGQ